MFTNSEIKSLLSKLDIYGLKAILRQYYIIAKNKPASVYNALNKPFDALKYELNSLVISGEIKTIDVVEYVELYK